MTVNLSIFSHFTICDFSIWEVYYIPLIVQYAQFRSIEIFPAEKMFGLPDRSLSKTLYCLLWSCQEFHLSQTYHEGLHKLQTKEYKRASELLESVLKDPLIANAQVRPSKKYFYRW